MSIVVTSNTGLANSPSLALTAFEDYKTYVSNGGGSVYDERVTEDIFLLLASLGIPISNVYGWGPYFGIIEQADGDVEYFFDLGERHDFDVSSGSVPIAERSKESNVDAARYMSSQIDDVGTLSSIPDDDFIQIALGWAKSDVVFSMVNQDGQDWTLVQDDNPHLTQDWIEKVSGIYNRTSVAYQSNENYQGWAGLRRDGDTQELYSNGTKRGDTANVGQISNYDFDVKLLQASMAILVHGSKYATPRNAKVISEQLTSIL